MTARWNMWNLTHKCWVYGVDFATRDEAIAWDKYARFTEAAKSYGLDQLAVIPKQTPPSPHGAKNADIPETET